MILLILLYALCASSFTLCKAVLAYSSPLFFIAVRMLVAGGLLLVLAGKKQLAIPKRDWLLFALVMLFHIYGAYVFELSALQWVSSSQSALFFSLSPFITALLAWALYGKNLTKEQIGGLFVGFIGILLTTHAMGIHIHHVAASFLLLLSVIASCIGWLLVQQLMEKGYSALLINGIGMVGGGALALGTSALTEGIIPMPVSEWQPFIGLTLLIIILINGLFYNAYSFLLRRYSATMLSFFGFSCPFFASVFGFLFLNEPISYHFFIALLLVGAGLYMFYRAEIEKARIVKNYSSL